MGRRQERAEQFEEIKQVRGPRSKVHARPSFRLEAKTETQGHYLVSIESNQLTFGLGPAGTGKTYVATMWAANQLDAGKVEKIIVTRPAVEAGKGLGFLPGEIGEKFAPYFAPFRQVFVERFGQNQMECMIKNGKIDIQPLEYIRGLTFDNCIVILDEAQNTTTTQMKLFLTRLGERSKVIINGDVTQQDISGLNGLEDATTRLADLGGVGIVTFDEDDIVRSGLVREVLRRYRNPTRKK